MLLEAGQTWAVIRDKLGYTERLKGLFHPHAGHGPAMLKPMVEARILGISSGNLAMDRRIGVRENRERNCISPT